MYLRIGNESYPCWWPFTLSMGAERSEQCWKKAVFSFFSPRFYFLFLQKILNIVVDLTIRYSPTACDDFLCWGIFLSTMNYKFVPELAFWAFSHGTCFWVWLRPLPLHFVVFFPHWWPWRWCFCWHLDRSSKAVLRWFSEAICCRKTCLLTPRRKGRFLDP